jgi:hypothetical protein
MNRFSIFAFAAFGLTAFLMGCKQAEEVNKPLIPHNRIMKNLTYWMSDSTQNHSTGAGYVSADLAEELSLHGLEGAASKESADFLITVLDLDKEKSDNSGGNSNLGQNSNPRNSAYLRIQTRSGGSILNGVFRSKDWENVSAEDAAGAVHRFLDPLGSPNVQIKK